MKFHVILKKSPFLVVIFEVLIVQSFDVQKNHPNI
jgi:hypothetical protein